MTDAALPLAERRALVIGAGTPAGRIAALALAGAGADVAVAAGSIDGEEVMAVRRVRRAIEAQGRRSAEYAFDVTLGANVRVSTRQVAKEMGGLDILVYAADAFLRKPTEKTSDADWSRMLNINLNGAFYACRAALGEMAAGGGRIILVSSVLGERGAAESAAYCAARHGVNGLVRALAQELPATRLGVNAVALGWPPLDAISVPPSGSAQPAAEGFAALGPLVVYLATPGPVSGQIIAVDGGTAAGVAGAG